MSQTEAGVAYDALTTDAFAWNSFAGNVHGLALDRRRPALTLCSYKFSLAEAIAFELHAAGRPCALREAHIAWQPHAVTGTYRHDAAELRVEALFIRPEVVAVRYTLRGTQLGEPLTLHIRGIARNGEDKDRFFVFAGEPRVRDGLAAVEQSIDIPDYHMRPVGTPRRFRHHLAWLVDADAAPALDDGKTCTRDAFYLGGENISDAWSACRTVTPQDDGTWSGTLFVAMRWLGNAPLDGRDVIDLKNQLCVARADDFDAAASRMQARYADFLLKLPAVAPQYRNNHDYLRLYAQAWVCIRQNVTGDLITARKTLPSPSAFVSKVADNGFGPAQWETSLAGYLLSFIDAELGVAILESVLACVEEDGFLPEDLIFNRDVKLASLEPYMLEEIANRTGRSDFLSRNYDVLYRQLLFHIKHPGFQYLTSGDSHLAIENYYSLLALERIARRLGRDAAHLQTLRWLREDMEQALNAAFARESETGPVFEFLHGYLDAAAARPIIERLKTQHLTAGAYFMSRHPDGVNPKTGKQDLDGYKMVLFLHFILGLEQLGERDFLATLTARTFEGLKAAGDFWECYRVNGDPWGNGPMSIFGAFGWIWLLMERPA